MDPTFSRKDFFRTAFFRFAGGMVDALATATAVAPAPGETRRAPPRPARPLDRFVRPPGAMPEPDFLRRCTRCGDCLRACPHLVIRPAGPEFGTCVVGTPILIPRENPCLFCAQLWCTESCPTGALEHVQGKPRIGRARVDADRCWMALRQPCDYCRKHCPVRPRAIQVGSPGAAAVVDAEACNGCGVCAQLCPAGAIAIEDHR